VRRQVADPADRREGAGTLGERRFGDFGTRGGRTGMFSGWHESIVANGQYSGEAAGYTLSQHWSKKMRSIALVLIAIAALASLPAANALDLNGKWKGEMKTPNGDMLEINFNFHVDGEKLTGTAASTYGEEQITEGVVKGDAVNFVIMAGGGEFKIVYKGKVVGDDIKFNVTIGDMGDGELTAKRVK
jgi:hypothetical protein